MQFISTAMAQSATTVSGAQDSGTISFLMIVGIFILFYFMLIRPQNKRARDHQSMVAKIKVGDEVVINGGILAKVSQLNEQYLKVTVAEAVEIKIQRNAVSMILPKGTLKSI